MQDNVLNSRAKVHAHLVQVEGESASLDDLRSGNAGNLLDLSDRRLAEVFTNEYLPRMTQA